jgi:hypothetical protein
MIRRSVGLLLSLAVGSLVVIGCSSGGDDVDSGTGALTPKDPATLDDQRALCKQREAENGAFRNQDIASGVVRWKCGDVAGVTKSDLGQEYCEFHAMQAGKVVDRTAHSAVAKTLQDDKNAQVECLFTGVYGDVKGEPGSKENQTFGAKLNKALTDEAGNLTDVAKGGNLAATGKNPLSVMNGPFNSRGAATTLLSDCQGAAQVQKDAARVNAADDTVKCAADGTGCESPRDVEACTLITGHGVGWRNSDPIICGRAARGALCGGEYDSLPDALDGFIMTDWKADLPTVAKVWAGKSTDKIPAPANCRYATVDGKQYLHLLICTPTAAQINNPKYDGQLQQMCSDTFGPSIAMTAPIGLVAKGVKDAPGFCSDFDKGNQALAGLVK